MPGKSGVTNELVLHFKDGSLYEETYVFTQQRIFHLVAYHLVQRGPAFKRGIDMSLDVAKGQFTNRYTDDDGKEKTVTESFSLPSDVANGLVTTLLNDIGDKARMDIGRESCQVFTQGAEKAHDQPGFAVRLRLCTDVHVANFLKCVRTRETPSAPVEICFQAALVAQLANLSLKHGRRVRWNGPAEPCRSEPCVPCFCCPRSRGHSGRRRWRCPCAARTRMGRRGLK